MHKSFWIAFRALLALLLMAGFYLLALGIAGALLWTCYATVVYAHRIIPKLILLCVAGAGVILWSILPRFDKFEAPGPVLGREGHPDLFRVLDSIAAVTRQAMPSEVFLVNDFNAWVAQRGGIMGFGSRRVMGLGLPLLQTLTVAELRAVLAHEFGHFFSGDTRLGPWVYKTRSAIIRTVVNLARAGNSVLQKPFEWYGNLFLRVTHAVSRQQELSADALAARTVGAEPLSEGLRKTTVAGAAFAPYWQSEVVPVLESGFRPPIAEGFARFLSADRVAELLRGKVDEELKEGPSQPYDTHPPLRERLAAIAKLPDARRGGARPGDERPAISLLRDVAPLEKALLASLADEAKVHALTEVGWDEVGERVYVPMWRAGLADNHAAFAAVTVDDVPRLAGNLHGLERTLIKLDEPLESEAAKRRAALLLGAALAHALHRAGWKGSVQPGAKVVFEGERGVAIAPFSIVDELAEGTVEANEWMTRCEAAGIVGLPLSA